MEPRIDDDTDENDLPQWQVMVEDKTDDRESVTRALNVPEWGTMVMVETKALMPDGSWAYAQSLVPLACASAASLYSASTLSPKGKLILGWEALPDEPDQP